MPVFRNVTPKSQFGTLEGHIYDGNGSWLITQFTALAEVEKKVHRAKYPDYVYSPRDSTKRKGTKKARNTSQPTPPTTPSVATPEPDTPTEHDYRVPMANMREFGLAPSNQAESTSSPRIL
ncbi:hypothetical protein BYT27DRAFT_7336817 [Phlegmacium glaucopus]|nr:hypothetical protein BYT27DRAFT_7336817 [Phlegmacium glaucopus]